MRRPAPRGVRLVTLYKLVKGAAEAVLAAVLVAAILTGNEAELTRVAEQLRRHVAGAWSVRVADLALALTVPRRLWAATFALAIDGALTVLEGWALVHGAAWGPWLVVVATSVLVPFEIVALVHHLHFGRLVLLVVNVAIVAYLLGRATREHAGRGRVE